MPSKKSSSTSRRVVFKKADFKRFADKIEKWGKTLPPEEQALLLAVIDKGSKGIRSAGDRPPHVTTSLNMEASDFDLGQFIVELLLALEGISAEVDEDGPSWVQEISWAGRGPS